MNSKTITLTDIARVIFNLEKKYGYNTTKKSFDEISAEMRLAFRLRALEFVRIHQIIKRLKDENFVSANNGKLVLYDLSSDKEGGIQEDKIVLDKKINRQKLRSPSIDEWIRRTKTVDTA